MSTEDTELLDTINLDESELDNIEDDTEDVDALREQIVSKDNFARQALARAKKAEAELKAMKSQPAKPTQNSNNLTSEEIEAKILKAQSVPDDEIEELRQIAKMKGISIIDAQNTTYFKAFKSEKDAQEKSERAKMGVSSRSGQQKQQKTFNTPGLSDADHKAKWLESQR